MREGWEVLPFGDVLTHDVRKVPVEAGRDYPIVGVLGFGRGLLFREPVSAKTTGYHELNVIKPDQVVYSKLKAFEGAITVTPPDLPESYASGEFPTFTFTGRAIPAFIRLLTQRSGLWAAMAANSKGMGGRRERLNPLDFLTVRAAFPPLPEQRRIADLIGALDDVVGRHDGAVKSAAHLRFTLLQELDEAGSAARTTLGTVVRGAGGSIKTGPFGTALKAAEYVQDGVPVISTGEVRRGYLQLKERTPRVGHEVLERLPGYTLEAGDIVFARKGAVDRSAWVEDHEAGYFLGSDGLRVRTGLGIEDSRLIAIQLQTPSTLAWLELNATGTVMKGLNQRILEAIPIARPTAALRNRFLGPVLAIDHLISQRESAIRALRGLRSDLLSALLSGEHEIPESYDERMEVAS